MLAAPVTGIFITLKDGVRTPVHHVGQTPRIRHSRTVARERGRQYVPRPKGADGGDVAAGAQGLFIRRRARSAPQKSEQGAEALRGEVGEKTRGPDRQVRRAAVAEGERGAAAVEYLAHDVVCSSTSRASVYDVIRMLSPGGALDPVQGRDRAQRADLEVVAHPAPGRTSLAVADVKRRRRSPPARSERRGRNVIEGEQPSSVLLGPGGSVS